MKNIGVLTLLITATLLLTLAFPVGAASPRAAAAPVVAAAAPAAAASPAMPPHPEIAAALEAMHAARHHLDDAAHDFHGHRVKAIEHLDAAIHEADVCMQEP
ncbi:MAG TPA: hypothetical protein VK706_04090 [Candidatus Sulfotelmatobacter sp.]|jgi:hypothetical protein|nr:hypothetical protein [Candidatus Sulfotelmatobacter sp.]